MATARKLWTKWTANSLPISWRQTIGGVYHDDSKCTLWTVAKPAKAGTAKLFHCQSKTKFSATTSNNFELRISVRRKKKTEKGFQSSSRLRRKRLFKTANQKKKAKVIGIDLENMANERKMTAGPGKKWQTTILQQIQYTL